MRTSHLTEQVIVTLGFLLATPLVAEAQAAQRVYRVAYLSKAR